MGEVAKLHTDLEALVGTLVHDRYRVDSLLGVGGMGAVFKGYHTGLKREVAIKLLHPEIGRDESISKRFDREAYSASRLDHPNCVRVSDFGTTDAGAKYLVMELLEGAELEASLGQPWAPLDAVRVAKQMFAGLEHAHHFGVVHRDLKPENVFVTTDFRGQQVIKLVDFGIAKLLDGEGVHEKLTRTGLVFGTPRYMSPEQASGGKIDERSDLYAAGLITYEMLAGKPPFDADEPGQLLRMHIIAPPPPLPSGVPAGLVAIVDKLLEKSKSDRYSTAREVLDALEGFERELIAAPVVAAAPIVVAAAPIVVAAAPIVAPLGERKTGWQPATTTTTIPPPPPPAAEPIAPSVAVLPPAPVLPTAPMPPVAPLHAGTSGGMTMPMIVAPGPLPGSFPGPTSTGSHASLSFANANASASVSQAWPIASTSAPIQRRSTAPWVIAGVAIVVAASCIAALIWAMQTEPKADSTTDAEPSVGVPNDSLSPPAEPVIDPSDATDPPSRVADEPAEEPAVKPAEKPIPARQEPAKPNGKVIDEADAAAIEDAIDHFFNDPTPEPKKGKGGEKGGEKGGGKAKGKGHH